MKRTRYFAYGSNLDADQMRKRCPSSLPIGRAQLAHHRIDFTHFSRRWQGGAADVVPHSGASVWGVVYELDESDLTRLDRSATGYDRVFLRVEIAAGELEDAISYTVRSKGSYHPTRVYLEKMLRWGEHHELPHDYLAALRPLLGPESGR